MGRRDGQQPQRDGRIGDYLVGAPGVQRLGTDVKRGGDGQEGGEQPQAGPGSFTGGLLGGGSYRAHVRSPCLSRPAGRRGSRFRLGSGRRRPRRAWRCAWPAPAGRCRGRMRLRRSPPRPGRSRPGRRGRSPASRRDGSGHRPAGLLYGPGGVRLRTHRCWRRR